MSCNSQSHNPVLILRNTPHKRIFSALGYIGLLIDSYFNWGLYLKLLLSGLNGSIIVYFGKTTNLQTSNS